MILCAFALKKTTAKADRKQKNNGKTSFCLALLAKPKVKG
jgi:hypothetical protein